MREIKFKVWHKIDKRFIGFYGSGLYIWPNGQIYAGGMEVTDRIELLQYTGLKDKNGAEIYEGDLLRRTYNTDDEWEKVNYVAYEVFFHDNDCADKHIGFQMNRVHFQGSVGGTSDFINFLPKYVKNLEIIGNIYENPELIAV